MYNMYSNNSRFATLMSGSKLKYCAAYKNPTLPTYFMKAQPQFLQLIANFRLTPTVCAYLAHVAYM